MAARLPAWIFLLIALILMSIAQLPLMRVAVGIDPQISMPLSSMAMFMIGALMSGLSAMILLAGRQPKLTDYTNENADKRIVVALHASGLLLFTGIPFANFLVAYYLWNRFRHQSKDVDLAGIAVINFQITVFLYLLLSLFMIIAVLGLFTTPLLLIFYAVCVIIATLQAMRGKSFHYPTNISIIQGRSKSGSIKG